MQVYKNTYLGLIGIAGIYITASIALPCVNILKPLSPEQLMVARGGVTAVLVALLLRGNIAAVEKSTLLFSFFFSCACLGFYNGIRIWGPSLTLIILTTTPIVNFLVSYRTGRKIPKAAVVSLTMLLCGVALALKPWTGAFNVKAFLWSAFGAVTAGIGYEYLSDSKAPKLQQCFWISVMIMIFGVFGSLHASWTPVFESPKILGLLIGFAFVGGFLYFLANFEAFKHLPVETASVLAQGETPAVIFTSGIFLGEHLSVLQWCGVALAISGAYLLVHSISKKDSSHKAS